MGTKTEQYLEMLSEEGFRPTVDEEGDITFKYEGIRLYIVVSEKDPQYFKIADYLVWAAESEAERIKAERVARQLNIGYKVVKVLQQDNRFGITIEMFVPTLDVIQPVLIRILDMLKYVRNEFINLMNKPEEVDAVIEETLDESIH